MKLDKFVKLTVIRANHCRPAIYCKDGFKMSVQGGDGMYCSPRAEVDKYDSMEVGFPSERVELLMEYAEDSDKPTETVYGWVPVGIIQKVINLHGGIDVEKTLNR